MQLAVPLLLVVLLSAQSIHVHGQDIVDVAIADGNFKTLVQALTAADLVNTLKSAGPFTVLAPTDAAFAKLPAGFLDNLLQPDNKQKLADILKSHVLNGRVPSADILKLNLPTQVDTLVGIKAIVDKVNTTIKVNGVTVTAVDVGASNGIIHVLDEVLLPLPDIVKTAVSDDRFKTLVSALTAAGLVDTLKGAGPFTVFAPTDAAFASLPAGLLDELLKVENKEFLGKILQYHVTGQLVTAPSINRMTLPSDVNMLAGGTAKVTKDGNTVKINDAVVTQPDIFNTNGMIHVIGKVILPPLNIVETAITNGIFKTLLTALGEVNLVSTLQGAGPFTVFAPTDAAFAKLPAGVLDELVKPENKESLSDILSYHVRSGRLSAAEILSMSLPANITMLAGGTTTLSFNGSTVAINNAAVIKPDVSATNGLIHVIDTVIFPQLNIVKTAITNGNFKTLLAALRAADLVSTLEGDGPFTVFAPTDAAFAKLPPGVVEELIKSENKESLKNILKYHVIGKRVSSAEILNMTSPADITMLTGDTSTLRFNRSTVTINNAAVITPDVSNTNGLIHVIDTVILPPLNIVETAIINGNFKALVAALRKADLASTLSGTGPFTVFAPNDAAFVKLANGSLDDLETLKNTLKYHVVVAKKILAADIKPPEDLEMLAGGIATVTKPDGKLKIEEANIIATDVGTNNGVIHVIDTVMTPRKNSASFSYGSQGLVAVLLSTVMFVYHSTL